MNDLHHIPTIGKLTFIELIRDKVLYYVFAAVAALLGFSLFLGGMALFNRDYMVQSLVLTTLSVGGLFLIILSINSVVHKEIKRRTALAVLARPISRSAWLAGRTLGVSMVSALFITVLTSLMWLVAPPANIEVFFQALFLIIVEQFLIICAGVLFAVLSTPGVSPLFLFGLYACGHLATNLKAHFAASRMLSAGVPEYLDGMATVLTSILPPLSKLQLTGPLVYGSPLPWTEVMYWGAYGTIYAIALWALASFSLSKKDFA